MDTGHIGIYVSGKCQEIFAPKIAGWLNERDADKKKSVHSSKPAAGKKAAPKKAAKTAPGKKVKAAAKKATKTAPGKKVKTAPGKAAKAAPKQAD